jgi:hypothetical protein
MAQGDLLVDGREAFDANELVQVWFLHHLAVIGGRHSSQPVRALAPRRKAVSF